VEEAEKLLEALKVIQSTCEQQQECCYCPLQYLEGMCALEKEPASYWDLVDWVPGVSLIGPLSRR